MDHLWFYAEPKYAVQNGIFGQCHFHETWAESNKVGNETEFGKPGIRATWIGHATVLAEVDEAIVICDPIFRYSIGQTLKVHNNLNQ